MTVFRLPEMKAGWFVGDFEPAALRTSACEVACKRYAKGATETRHMHRIATELTLVASGAVRMNGATYGPGDIVLIAPGDATDFEALDDTMTVVVKIPSVSGDKYQVG